MTAIYAGVSKDLNFGILASDDLESNYGRKVDKVFILGKKFAFAVTGLDTAAHAIREIAFFEYYSNIEIPTNIHDLAVLIGNTTLNICKRLKPHFKNDRHWHSLQRSSIGIVALDLKDLQLYFLEYGCPFHPERYYATPKIETKASGQLHFFALAKKIEMVPSKTLDQECVEDPSNYFENIINSHRLKNDKIGHLGARVITRNGDIELLSCYSDIKEYIDYTYRHLMGFTINLSSDS